MSDVSMRDLFEAGAHFGHRTRYWNPKMAPYIYGARGGIHIINLEKTVPMLDDAINFLGTIAANGGNILFVGTKRSATDTIKTAAEDCHMPYVNHRWLGGMMTNYKTIRQSVRKLHGMRKAEEDGKLVGMTKKEIINMRKEQAKLEASLGGVAEMRRLPDVLFIADVGYESIALQEAKVLGIPVVGIVDTNNSPDGVDYIIPSNDDSVRALQLIINAVAAGIKDAKAANTVAERDEEAAEAAPVAKKKVSKQAKEDAEKTEKETSPGEEKVTAGEQEKAAPAAEEKAAAGTAEKAAPAGEEKAAEKSEENTEEAKAAE
ncbi:MAG: 30S ribosomal protein S2 [Gammaproteobacteria bacterium]|nr:MAG: 30S ribosomal protein S2 [Gammaproteobacteria bacterium]